MRLQVTGRYRSGYGSYEAGQVIDMTEEQAAILLRDSPGTFIAYTETDTSVEAADRSMRGGRKR